MPFHVAVHYGDRRILVRHQGPYTIDDARAAAADVRHLSATTGYRQVLVDLRGMRRDPALTYSQLYALATAVAAELGQHVYMAALYDADQPFASKIRFVESAAEREGLLGRGFLTEPDAITWLLAMERDLAP